MKYEVILWKRGSGANMRSKAIVEAQTATEAKEHAQAQYGSLYDVRHVHQLQEPKQTERTLAAGLAGGAIGAAIARRKEAKRDDEAQHRAEFQARQAQAEAERTARTEARHAIGLAIQCPICAAYLPASMASDGYTQVTCRECGNRMRVSHSGDVSLLGPKEERVTKAEDLEITEDRLCSKCRYFRPKWKRLGIFYLLWIAGLAAFYLYGWQAGWIHSYWKVVGGTFCGLVLAVVAFISHIGLSPCDRMGDKCANRDAQSVTGYKDPERINPNLRCKFWSAKTT